MDREELFLVLECEPYLPGQDEAVRASAGETVLVPARTLCVANEGSEDATLIAITSAGM